MPFSCARLAGVLTGAVLLVPASAQAASVTVRVEGRTTVVRPVVVQTVASFTKKGDNDGADHACSGPSLATALEAAVGGAWSGDWYAPSFTVNTVRGETHLFGSGAYWSYYRNGRYVNDTTCGQALQDGDDALFYVADDPFAPGSGGYEEPVLASAPATVAPGAPFTVTVKELNTTFDASYSGTTTHDPSAGATVAGGGASAQTGAGGTASLTLTERGPAELVTTKGDRVPDRDVVCVTDGADGFCGTTKPGEAPAPSLPSTTTTTTPSAGSSPVAPPAFGKVTSVEEGVRFTKGRGPRTLAGTATGRGGVQAVQLKLTRSQGARCSYFSVRVERWVRTSGCGASRGRYFTVSEEASWSYLLPERLERGRYVLDLRVRDAAGDVDGDERDELARGRNRIVFTVS